MLAGYDPAAPMPPRLRFVSSDQISSIEKDIDLQPCPLQGYPSDRVQLPINSDQRPFLESDGLFTLSISPGRRRARRNAGIDIAIEYPPHDRSLEGQGLPDPPGVSGGGIWLFPRFVENLIWSADKVKLLAIARGWWREECELLGTKVECWLSMLKEELDNPTR
jgi:hypothetical protein